MLSRVVCTALGFSPERRTPPSAPSLRLHPSIYWGCLFLQYAFESPPRFFHVTPLCRVVPQLVIAGNHEIAFNFYSREQIQRRIR